MGKAEWGGNPVCWWFGLCFCFACCSDEESCTGCCWWLGDAGPCIRVVSSVWVLIFDAPWGWVLWSSRVSESVLQASALRCSQIIRPVITLCVWLTCRFFPEIKCICSMDQIVFPSVILWTDWTRLQFWSLEVQGQGASVAEVSLRDVFPLGPHKASLMNAGRKGALKKNAFLNWDTWIKALQEQTCFKEWQQENIKTKFWRCEHLDISLTYLM